MPRPTTALVQIAVSGRARGGVRVNAPAAHHRSHRILWTGDDGRRYERTRLTLDAAVAHAHEVAHELAAALAGTVRPAPRNVTLGVLVDHYLFGDGRPVGWRSPKSAQRMHDVAKRTLEPQDLNIPAEALTGPVGVRTFGAILRRTEGAGCIAGGTELEKAGIFLGAVLKAGARDGLIDLTDGNPMTGLRYRLSDFASALDSRLLTVNYIGPEQTPPTERVRDLIDAARRRYGEREALYLGVAAFGGLRPGEMAALSVDHVRLDKSGLTVREQVVEQRRRIAGADGLTQIVTPPKWGMSRVAWLAPDVYDELLPYAESRDTSTKNGSLLFPAPAGGYRWSSNYRRDVWNPLCEHVGWPSHITERRGRTERHWTWTQYSLRHHYASYLLKTLDVPIILVARWMGHRDVQVTQTMYVQNELGDLDLASKAHAALTASDTR